MAVYVNLVILYMFHLDFLQTEIGLSTLLKFVKSQYYIKRTSSRYINLCYLLIVKWDYVMNILLHVTKMHAFRV